jgi:dCTP deaminase
MILTDREIQAAIEHEQIKIAPPPSEIAYSSTSLDLTLSKSIRVWKEPTTKGVEHVISPSTEGYKFNEFLQEYSILKVLDKDGFVLKPHVFVLGWTQENIELPVYARLAARVEGKSSLARLGIGIHITAPTIHAGFNGTIQLEICNHGPLDIRLTSGMPVCQLIFEQTLGTPVKGYAGQFSGQSAK